MTAGCGGSDPDAPNGTFTHWVLLDLAPQTTELSEGSTPPGAMQANNSAGEPSYAGPCPPSGTHHYRFTADAIARGRLTAVYKRQ
ncbi:YbhB/YbcL family Raf kinase inhibitor-like protein [Kribbella jiaozuonensis]|uniref:YbhB/YbcL family Raf kinase inhibitor-like protein n=1 Tax=Kribbella jiaozuonensis TaxID=2575441 RepID=A0A4U3M6A0_9ACTN|nr:YbhB/YbcL family Raf kinase inhibitor-like protein [Kribbella jiaozuonensis]TKK82956.1 YbhB/YbcL family Raf kinase inhibitor-like protein [Kribbella jiaozuonensis]